MTPSSSLCDRKCIDVLDQTWQMTSRLNELASRAARLCTLQVSPVLLHLSADLRIRISLLVKPVTVASGRCDAPNDFILVFIQQTCPPDLRRSGLHFLLPLYGHLKPLAYYANSSHHLDLARSISSQYAMLQRYLSVTRNGRTLILCFDGTGNSFTRENTNVVRFFRALEKRRQDEQLCYYQPGIGKLSSPLCINARRNL